MAHKPLDKCKELAKFRHFRQIRIHWGIWTEPQIEAYNYFSQWITFGSEGILRFRDPVENEKIIKYKDLIANAIMLQNVADMTNILHEMTGEGLNVSTEAVSTFSPYLREHIKRFGEYFIDLDTIPSPLQPDKEFLLAV